MQDIDSLKKPSTATKPVETKPAGNQDILNFLDELTVPSKPPPASALFNKPTEPASALFNKPTDPLPRPPKTVVKGPLQATASLTPLFNLLLV